MKLFSKIRRRLVLKLFFSYLVIIFTGIIVLAISAELVIPTAFDRHMSGMMGDSGSMSGMGMMPGDTMGNDLYDNFRAAVGEALFRAGLAAFLIALVVSVFVSRRVVSPVQELTTVSQFIADGHYEHRVTLPGNIDPANMDELAQLALTFNQMAEKLDQTENMRRQLIGDVSHELRTPLTTIKGSMEGLLDGVLSPTADTFENIYREASRLQRLVADLQELSRVESGAIPMELAPIKITPLIEAVTLRLQPQFHEKGVSLDLQIAKSLPTINANEDRLSQVVINLLGNALQYTSENGAVSLAVRPVGNEIEVSVTDNGIGISAEHLPHIFTRFYRVDKSRSRAGGGSGIGLTIARQIVKAHGGRIWADSDGPGLGSKFTFVLPIMDR